MTKRELIDEILDINLSARPQFLAQFEDDDLQAYLTHLRVLSAPRLSGDPSRYDKYFRNVPAVSTPRPQWRPTESQEQQEPADDTETDLELRHAAALAALDRAALEYNEPEASEPTEEGLDAHDLLDENLAVGPEEREQLLRDPEASAVEDDGDEPEMEAPFRLTSGRNGSSRPTCSAAGKRMLYGADGAQPPPRRRRPPKRRQQAAG